jgi:hypothetical protein
MIMYHTRLQECYANHDLYDFRMLMKKCKENGVRNLEAGTY